MSARTTPHAAVFVVALMLSALTFVACPRRPSTTTDGGVLSSCETRAECDAGQICSTNSVCTGCESSGQCSLKETCNSDARLCELREGWGSECATNETCQAGSWCKQGKCLDRAEVSLCPSGNSAECPMNERCNTITTVCEEDLGCSTNDDCAAGEVCNTGSRACVPKCTTDTQATICAAGEHCRNDICVQCDDASDCEAGLICDAAGRCSAENRCYSDRDCNVPLVCFVKTGACLEKAPPCISNDNCGVDERCEVTSGRCVPRACQPDRYESNNDDAHAFNVAAGAYRNLTLCEGDVDWFSLNLARGDQLGVNLDADAFAENSFSTVVMDSNGRSLAGGKLLTSYIAPVAAKYFVVISSIDPNQPYDVTFLLSRGVPCDDDFNEPNDAATQPTALNQQTQIEGTVCPQDQDWYELTVPAGKGATVRLQNYDSGRGLLRLCVFANDGVTQLQCTEDLQPVVSLNASSLSGNKLKVRVSGSGERIQNTYTLQVEYP